MNSIGINRLMGASARSFSTEVTNSLCEVWEAIGKKADTQWVAAAFGGTMLASFTAMGSGLYFASNQRFVHLESKIDAVESKLESRIDAVESKLESKIDAVESKIDNLTQIVMQVVSKCVD